MEKYYYKSLRLFLKPHDYNLGHLVVPEHGGLDSVDSYIVPSNQEKSATENQQIGCGGLVPDPSALA